MGGGLTCESKVGIGSKFELTFILEITDERHLLDHKEGDSVLRASSPSNLLEVSLRERRSSLAVVNEALHDQHATEFQYTPDGTLISPPRSHKDANQDTGELNFEGRTISQPPGGLEVNAIYQPETQGSPEIIRKGKTILLVEDNLVNRKVGARMLRSLGFEVMVTENGFEALQLMERQYGFASKKTSSNGSCTYNGNHIDLILMDCQMPGKFRTARIVRVCLQIFSVMDGFSATEGIRQLERQIGNRNKTDPPHIPIVALTASATSEYQRKCHRAGMDDFLAKVGRKSLLFSIAH